MARLPILRKLFHLLQALLLQAPALRVTCLIFKTVQTQRTPCAPQLHAESTVADLLVFDQCTGAIEENALPRWAAPRSGVCCGWCCLSDLGRGPLRRSEWLKSAAAQCATGVQSAWRWLHASCQRTAAVVVNMIATRN